MIEYFPSARVPVTLPFEEGRLRYVYAPQWSPPLTDVRWSVLVSSHQCWGSKSHTFSSRKASSIIRFVRKGISRMWGHTGYLLWFVVKAQGMIQSKVASASLYPHCLALNPCRKLCLGESQPSPEPGSKLAFRQRGQWCVHPLSTLCSNTHTLWKADQRVNHWPN